MFVELALVDHRAEVVRRRPGRRAARACARAAARGSGRRRRRRRSCGCRRRSAGRRSRTPTAPPPRPRRSRSASSQTTSGFLPPSSRQTFASRSPATRGDHPADRGRAGEADDGDARMLDERLPGLGAEALDDVEHARRQARLRREARERERASAGVSSDAFSTAALPHSSAGKTFQATFAIGVLAAMISPATPSGWRIVIAWRFGTALGRRPAVEAAALAGDEVAQLDRAADLAARVLRRLAGLGGDDRGDARRASRSSSCGDPAQDRAALGDRSRAPRRAAPRRPRPTAASTSARSRARDERRAARPSPGASFSKRARPRPPRAPRRRSRCRRCGRRRRSRREASVDAQLVAGHVAGRVGGEEEQRAAEVVGLGHAGRAARGRSTCAGTRGSWSPRTPPGESALTRTPRGPQSRAK